jgi:hypothetical protein
MAKKAITVSANYDINHKQIDLSILGRLATDCGRPGLQT